MKTTRKGAFLTRKKGTIHLNHVRHARTFWARFQGLLGESRERFTYALVFHLAEKGTLNASIHMLFMRMPIDVLWLDEKRAIVDNVENLKPWTLNYTPKEEAKYIVELPEGAIKKYDITNGSVLRWK